MSLADKTRLLMERRSGPGPRGEMRPMAQSDADRNLLYGLLALQMDLIAPDALVTAMSTWVSEKDKSLGQALVSQGALAEDNDALLESLVRRLMEKHDNHVRRSLAAVATAAAIRRDP